MARILVIDDDLQIREMLTQFLKRAEYEVLAAPDGKTALKLHHATPVDLIITDIIMPEKEGLETIMEFRRHFPAVKIIAISGGGKIGVKEYLDIAEGLGAQKTFSKPFELKELLEAVGEILQISKISSPGKTISG
jgi:DNA-binding response OmpR family regulator